MSLRSHPGILSHRPMQRLYNYLRLYLTCCLSLIRFQSLWNYMLTCGFVSARGKNYLSDRKDSPQRL